MQRVKSRVNPEIIFYLLVSLFVCILLIARAVKVQMAHDELATFFYYVQSGKFNPFFTSADTNNHFLNSFLTWISFSVFGAQPWALRLPNLLFIPVFLFSLYKICSLLESRLLRIITFLAVSCCLHLVEFLALSRGYGMSLSLLLLSIYFLIRWFKEPHYKYLVFSLLTIFGGCLANLALINVFALMILLVVLKILADKPLNGKSIIAIIVAGVLPLLFILAQVLYIKQHQGLVAGSSAGMWKVTIRTLFGYLFETSGPYPDIIPAVLFIATALAFGAVLLVSRKLRIFIYRPAPVFVCLLFGSLLTIIVLGRIFHINYPDDRIGSYLYLLAIPALTFSLDELASIRRKKSYALFALPLLLVPLHLVIFLNTSYSVWYKNDVIPERFYDLIMHDSKPGSPPPTVAAHGLRILVWNFMGYERNTHVNPVYFTTYPSYLADYQIVKISEVPGWQKLYDTIAFDANSGRHLLRLKKAPEIQEIAAFNPPESRNCDREFYMLAEGDARDWAGKILQVDLDVLVKSAEEPFTSRIVADINDISHQSLIYEYIQLDWLCFDFSGNGQRFCNTLLLGKLPENARSFKIYLWSIDKKPYDIKGKVSVKERIMN